MSSVLDSLLGRPTDDEEKSASAELVASAAEPDTYRPYLARARPQMGFVVVEADGTSHGFLYHTLHHPVHENRGGVERLGFSSNGVAVGMEGRGLKVIFQAMMRHVLVEARAHDGRLPVAEGSVRIDIISVEDTRSNAV